MTETIPAIREPFLDLSEPCLKKQYAVNAAALRLQLDDSYGTGLYRCS